MAVEILYVAFVLTVMGLAQTAAKVDGLCNTVHWGTMVLDKEYVPGVGLPAGKNKLRAHIPDNICGDSRKLVGISVLACDLVANEVPWIQVVNRYWVRIHRQGYSWMSEPGSLHIFVSCEDIPKEIEFPGNDWRRLRTLKTLSKWSCK